MQLHQIACGARDQRANACLHQHQKPPCARQSRLLFRGPQKCSHFCHSQHPDCNEIYGTCFPVICCEAVACQSPLPCVEAGPVCSWGASKAVHVHKKKSSRIFRTVCRIDFSFVPEEQVSMYVKISSTTLQHKRAKELQDDTCRASNNIGKYILSVLLDAPSPL